MARAGVRAIISAGWGGLGGKDELPEHVFMIENVPHEWLFTKVAAVVHHGERSMFRLMMRSF